MAITTVFSAGSLYCFRMSLIVQYFLCKETLWDGIYTYFFIMKSLYENEDQLAKVLRKS